MRGGSSFKTIAGKGPPGLARLISSPLCLSSSVHASFETVIVGHDIYIERNNKALFISI